MTRLGRAAVERGEMLKRDDLSQFALFGKRIDLRKGSAAEGWLLRFLQAECRKYPLMLDARGAARRATIARHNSFDLNG